MAWEAPHGSLSWAAPENIQQNRAFLGREVGVPLVSQGFWPEEGWEVGGGRWAAQHGVVLGMPSTAGGD